MASGFRWFFLGLVGPIGAMKVRISTFLTHPEVQAWNYGERETSLLAEALPDAEIRICATEAEFLDALPETEIALVWHFPLEWTERAPHLKWVATPAAGREYLPEALAERVRVTYGTFHGKIMSETVLGMMLAAKRSLFAWQDKQQPWPRAEFESGAGLLRGSRATILGFGPIGRDIAATLLPLGVRVTAVKKSPPQSVVPNLAIHTVDALPSLLPETDHLIMVLPDTPETYHLMSGDQLALLPKTAWLYNVGRGKALDESALARAIQAGDLAGAFLDVFEEEPLTPDSPLRQLDQVFLLPHASAICPEYLFFFTLEVISHARGFGFTAE